MLKRFMMKMNKPYLESFLSAEQLTLKYSRVRQKQPKLRDKNQQQVKDEHVQNSLTVKPQQSHHRREHSVNGTTGEVVAKKAREQALAERRVESCDQRAATSQTEGYEIIQGGRIPQDEAEDAVAIFMKTAQSPDVQTLKRRLIENAHSRQQNGKVRQSFLHNTQPESAIKQHLDTIKKTSEHSTINHSEVRKSNASAGAQHRKGSSEITGAATTLHHQVKLKYAQQENIKTLIQNLAKITQTTKYRIGSQEKISEQPVLKNEITQKQKDNIISLKKLTELLSNRGEKQSDQSAKLSQSMLTKDPTMLIKQQQKRDHQLYQSIGRDSGKGNVPESSLHLSPDVHQTKIKATDIHKTSRQRSRKADSRKSNLETPAEAIQQYQTQQASQNQSFFVQKNNFAIQNFNDNLILLNYTSSNAAQKSRTSNITSAQPQSRKKSHNNSIVSNANNNNQSVSGLAYASGGTQNQSIVIQTGAHHHGRNNSAIMQIPMNTNVSYVSNTTAKRLDSAGSQKRAKIVKGNLIQQEPDLMSSTYQQRPRRQPSHKQTYSSTNKSLNQQQLLQQLAIHNSTTASFHKTSYASSSKESRNPINRIAAPSNTGIFEAKNNLFSPSTRNQSIKLLTQSSGITSAKHQQQSSTTAQAISQSKHRPSRTQFNGTQGISLNFEQIKQGLMQGQLGINNNATVYHTHKPSVSTQPNLGGVVPPPTQATNNIDYQFYKK
ncbi:hypothetical protein FGO68_gene11767 [Halteria grandinella]|uniref:Uncharacterized protein n=1 Tax=Halteria grandinella TaxID=5974 RepID=A0A8J8SX84_HALGN|nr:hypothetical protein FGO68_gene11767 [Halteria grandinella]